MNYKTLRWTISKETKLKKKILSPKSRQIVSKFKLAHTKINKVIWIHWSYQINSEKVNNQDKTSIWENNENFDFQKEISKMVYCTILSISTLLERKYKH